MDKGLRKLIIIGLVVIAVIGLGYLTYQSILSSRRGTVVMDSIPQDLKLTLNGKRIASTGKLTITPGTYTLEAERSGFASDKKEITVEKKTTQTIQMYLLPNSPEGEEWVKNHPQEAYKLEGLVGAKLEKATQQAIVKNNLITELPYIGPGFFFRIDYGPPQPGSKYPDQPNIYITGETAEKRDMALVWMRSHGYNPDTMNIVMQEKPVQ